MRRNGSLLALHKHPSALTNHFGRCHSSSHICPCCGSTLSPLARPLQAGAEQLANVRTQLASKTATLERLVADIEVSRAGRPSKAMSPSPVQITSLRLHAD